MEIDPICRILVTTLFLTLLAGNACATDVNLNSSIDARELADELTDDGWVMYGTDQCGWCVRQKEEFGDAFANVTYVNCMGDRQACMNVSMYLFTWDEVTGNNSGRLLEYLTDNYRAGWAKSAEIRKSDDGRTIRIFNGENSAEIMIDEENAGAILKINNGKPHYLKVKNEGGDLNIYAGIEGIPCWVSPDSTLHPGYYNLTRLSGMVDKYRAAHPAPTPTTAMSTLPATIGFESAFALTAIIVVFLMRRR